LHLRKFREREGAFLVEGADLVAAGRAAGLEPQAVFVRDGSPVCDELTGGGSPTGGALAGLSCHRVTDRVAARIATLETPADVAAVFAAPAAPPLAALPGAAGMLLILYADQVADPGNMGTLVRAAAGFGAAAVATSPGSVDLLSPKVVRASMGAVFGVPLYQAVELDDMLDALTDAPPDVCGLVAHDGDDLRATTLSRPALLCVGAERAGLSAAVEARLTRRLTIPLAGGEARGVESLNAGVAGAIALYEFSRRPAGGAPHDPQGRLQAPGEG
jgi:TrmH family RNA methyltransferase